MPILRAIKEADDGEAVEAGQGVPLMFTAATAGRKPDGLNLDGLPWDFSRAVTAPDGAMQYPFLWVHDIMGNRAPLGVANIVPGDKPLPLRVAVTFDPGDPFAVDIERKYRSPVGGLSAVSIQWDDMDADGMPARATKSKPVAHQLWEVSAVPVGMDPDALRDGARMAARALYDDIGAMLDGRTVATETDTEPDTGPVADIDVTIEVDGAPEAEAEDQETRLAAAMVAVFRAGAWSDEADAERRAAYNGLLPAYRRAGWTAPEFLPLADLRALDEDTWRGLFMSGELQRAGAEFSSKNVAELREIDAALRDASRRLGALITRATVKAETPATAGEGRGGDSEHDLMAAMGRLLSGGNSNG